MPEVAFIVIDDGRSSTTVVTIGDGSVRLRPERLQSALGYELKPEGLCHGGTCFPVTDRRALVNDDGVDLARCAGIVDRPLAIDVAERTGMPLTIKADDSEVGGDWAWRSGSFSGQDPSGATFTGKYIEVWQRTADGWKLHRDIWNGDAEAAPAASTTP